MGGRLLPEVMAGDFFIQDSAEHYSCQEDSGWFIRSKPGVLAWIKI